MTIFDILISASARFDIAVRLFDDVTQRVTIRLHPHFAFKLWSLADRNSSHRGRKWLLHPSSDSLDYCTFNIDQSIILLHHSMVVQTRVGMKNKPALNFELEGRVKESLGHFLLTSENLQKIKSVNWYHVQIEMRMKRSEFLHYWLFVPSHYDDTVSPLKTIKLVVQIISSIKYFSWSPYSMIYIV